MKPQSHLATINVSSSLQKTVIVILFSLVQAGVENTGPAVDHFHQWFHPAAFEQSQEPAALRVSELTYDQKLKCLIFRKIEIRTCVRFLARESMQQFTSVLPLSLWLTAAGLHLLFSSAFYNPGRVTVL